MSSDDVSLPPILEPSMGSAPPPMSPIGPRPRPRSPSIESVRSERTAAGAGGSPIAPSSRSSSPEPDLGVPPGTTVKPSGELDTRDFPSIDATIPGPFRPAGIASFRERFALKRATAKKEIPPTSRTDVGDGVESSDFPGWLEEAEEAKRRWVDSKYNDVVTLEPLYEGVIQRDRMMQVGRAYGYTPVTSDRRSRIVHNQNASYGDRKVTASPLVAAAGEGVVDTASMQAWANLQAFFGVSGVPYNREFQGHWSTLTDMPVNTCRLSMRMAILMLAAMHEAESGKLLVVSTYDDPSVLKIDNVNGLMVALAQGVNRRNFIPYQARSGSEQNALMLSFVKLISVNRLNIMAAHGTQRLNFFDHWPHIPDLTVALAGDALERLKTSWTASELWMLITQWTEHWGNIDEVREYMKFLSTICLTHSALGSGALLTQNYSYSLPQYKGAAFSLCPVLEGPTGEKFRKEVMPNWNTMVSRAVMQYKVMHLAHWNFVYKVIVRYYEYGLLNEEEIVDVMVPYVNNGGRAEIWDIIAGGMVQIGMKGSLGRLWGSVLWDKSGKSLLADITKWANHVIPWADMARHGHQLVKDAGIWGRLYPLYVESVARGKWMLPSHVKGDRTFDECMYSVFGLPGIRTGLMVEGANGTRSIQRWQPDVTADNHWVDYAFVPFQDKRGNVYRPIFQCTDKETCYIMESPTHIRYKLNWFINREETAVRAPSKEEGFLPDPFDPPSKIKRNPLVWDLPRKHSQSYSGRQYTGTKGGEAPAGTSRRSRRDPPQGGGSGGALVEPREGKRSTVAPVSVARFGAYEVTPLIRETIRELYSRVRDDMDHVAAMGGAQVRAHINAVCTMIADIVEVSTRRQRVDHFGSVVTTLHDRATWGKDNYTIELALFPPSARADYCQLLVQVYELFIVRHGTRTPAQMSDVLRFCDAMRKAAAVYAQNPTSTVQEVKDRGVKLEPEPVVEPERPRTPEDVEQAKKEWKKAGVGLDLSIFTPGSAMHQAAVEFNQELYQSQLRANEAKRKREASLAAAAQVRARQVEIARYEKQKAEKEMMSFLGIPSPKTAAIEKNVAEAKRLRPDLTSWFSRVPDSYKMRSAKDIIEAVEELFEAGRDEAKDKRGERQTIHGEGPSDLDDDDGDIYDDEEIFGIGMQGVPKPKPAEGAGSGKSGSVTPVGGRVAAVAAMDELRRGDSASIPSSMPTLDPPRPDVSRGEVHYSPELADETKRIAGEVGDRAEKVVEAVASIETDKPVAVQRAFADSTTLKTANEGVEASIRMVESGNGQAPVVETTPSTTQGEATLLGLTGVGASSEQAAPRIEHTVSSPPQIGFLGSVPFKLQPSVVESPLVRESGRPRWLGHLQAVVGQAASRTKKDEEGVAAPGEKPVRVGILRPSIPTSGSITKSPVSRFTELPPEATAEDIQSKTSSPRPESSTLTRISEKGKEKEKPVAGPPYRPRQAGTTNTVGQLLAQIPRQPVLAMEVQDESQHQLEASLIESAAPEVANKLQAAFKKYPKWHTDIEPFQHYATKEDRIVRDIGDWPTGKQRVSELKLNLEELQQIHFTHAVQDWILTECVGPEPTLEASRRQENDKLIGLLERHWVRAALERPNRPATMTDQMVREQATVNFRRAVMKWLGASGVTLHVTRIAPWQDVAAAPGILPGDRSLVVKGWEAMSSEPWDVVAKRRNKPFKNRLVPGASGLQSITQRARATAVEKAQLAQEWAPTARPPSSKSEGMTKVESLGTSVSAHYPRAVWVLAQKIVNTLPVPSGPMDASFLPGGSSQWRIARPDNPDWTEQAFTDEEEEQLIAHRQASGIFLAQFEVEQVGEVLRIDAQRFGLAVERDGKLVVEPVTRQGAIQQIAQLIQQLSGQERQSLDSSPSQSIRFLIRELIAKSRQDSVGSGDGAGLQEAQVDHWFDKMPFQQARTWKVNEDPATASLDKRWKERLQYTFNRDVAALDSWLSDPYNLHFSHVGVGARHVKELWTSVRSYEETRRNVLGQGEIFELSAMEPVWDDPVRVGQEEKLETLELLWEKLKDVNAMAIFLELGESAIQSWTESVLGMKMVQDAAVEITALWRALQNLQDELRAKPSEMSWLMRQRMMAYALGIQRMVLCPSVPPLVQYTGVVGGFQLTSRPEGSPLSWWLRDYSGSPQQSSEDLEPVTGGPVATETASGVQSTSGEEQTFLPTMVPLPATPRSTGVARTVPDVGTTSSSGEQRPPSSSGSTEDSGASLRPATFVDPQRGQSGQQH